MSDSPVGSGNFIRNIIDQDIRQGLQPTAVHTRFPPEPNGYLHIGHAKSICLNFGIAANYGGRCNLRFDDTNPIKEEVEYVEAIQEDVRWLGFDWADRVYFTSDYFERLYAYACHLIRTGKAFVCDLTAEQLRFYRGTLTEAGQNSPYRDRSVDENLDLFARMRAGEFADGTRTLRAKIDMSSGNLNLRDPVLYRILHAPHHRTGNRWCIYPSYDFAHGQSDAIEGITHSLCTLEFEDHRPLYDWLIEQLPVPSRPHQYEFARLDMTYTVLSKRKLLTLVKEGYVDGWDDPRMPTLCGLRRRGFTPASIRDFTDRIGVAKAKSIVQVELLEHCLREDLNKRAPRRMAVLAPVKVIIDNLGAHESITVEAINNPEDEAAGTRPLVLTREIFIDANDFREDAPKKYHRLAPGKEVRLKFACYITCREVLKHEDGTIKAIICTWDPLTLGGWSQDGRKVKGTIHWVSAVHAVDAEVRLYDNLFIKENPNEVNDGEAFTVNINPHSREVLTGCKVEPDLAACAPGDRVQFERTGYFIADAKDHTTSRPIFNRSVTLNDSWAKIEKQMA